MTRAGLALVAVMMCALPRPAARAQQLPITSFGVAEGLADTLVWRIVHDSHGWLWFCTNEGLSRFDGYEFTTFGTGHGLPDARVSDLLETHTGEYWLATGAGVVRFNPNGSPTTNPSPAPMFTLVRGPNRSMGARSAGVLRQSRSGAIWVGTDDGLFLLRLEGDRAVLSPVDIGLPEVASERHINTVLEDRTGSLWVGAPSGLYRRWPDGSSARQTISFVPGLSVTSFPFAS